MREQYSKQFDQIFKSESLRGERAHLKFNWILYTVVFILGYLVYFLQDNVAGLYGMILSVLNGIYNVFATVVVNKKNSSSLWISYSTIFLNVLTLTVYNFIDTCNNSSILPSTSATVLLYPIIIFLASLRMDKYLIIWASILSIIAMNGLYIWFYDSIDPNFVKQPMSIDILSQVFRTIYLIIIARFIYTVPRSMHRILKKQEQLAQENLNNKHDAQHDSLTGLYNRLYFEQHLSHYLQVAKELNSKVALLFMDLDKFKLLNDTYGHDFGDFALKVIAEKINCIATGNQIIARIGGDEFVIIMSNVSGLDEVKTYSQKVLIEIERKRMYKNVEILLGASIGISLYPDDTENMEQLIKYADEAMYTAKKSKKKGIVFYQSINSDENLNELGVATTNQR